MLKIPFELVDEDLSLKKHPHLKCFSFKKLSDRKFLCLTHNAEFESNYSDLNRCRVGYSAGAFCSIVVS